MSKLKSFTRQNFLTKNLSGLALILGVLIMSFLVGYLVFAWGEAPGTPPTCPVDYPGCAAPLNVGLTDQTKQGALIIGGGVTAPVFKDSGDTTYFIDPTGQAVTYYSAFLKGHIVINPFGTAAGNTSEIRLLELAANGTNFVSFKAPDSLTANNIYVWPTAYPAASGQVLSSTTTGTLSWVAGGGGSQNIWSTIATTSGTYPVPDTTSDTLTLTAGSGISITGDATADSVTIANTGDLSTTNEIQNVIANKGLQRDASNNFGIINCAAGQITKYNALNQWVCDTDLTGAGGGYTTIQDEGTSLTQRTTLNFAGAGVTCSDDGTKTNCSIPGGGGLPSGTSGDTLRYDGTNWVPNSVIYNNGTNVGIGVGSSIDSNYKLTIGSTGVKITNTGTQPSLYVEDISGDTTPFVIDANGNVGIGTTSPGNKLHVSGGWTQFDVGYGIGNELVTVGGWYRPSYGMALPGNASFGSLNFLAHSWGNAPHFAFRNGLDNTAWMVITGGNVGIGDTTPASLLTVGSGDLFQVNSSGDLIKIRGVTYSWPAAQGGANTFLQNNGSGTLSWAAAAGGGYWTLSGSNLYPNDTSWNVGIGTTSPIGALDVQGAGYLHVSGNTNPIVTSQGAYLGWNALTGGTGETDFINNQGGGSGGFAFMNTPSSGTPKTTLMFITGSGRVGIRQTDPGAALHIDNSPASTNSPYGLYVRTDRTGTGTIGNGVVSWVEGGTNNYGSLLQGTGGTNAAGAYGNAWNATYNYGVRGDATGDTGTKYALYGSTSGSGTKYGIYTTGEDKNYFFGNVGIGTPGPSSKLDVVGNIEIDSWDSQLWQGNYAGAGYMRRSIGGAHGFDSNTLYINGWNDWSSGVSIGGPGGTSKLVVTGTLGVRSNLGVDGYISAAGPILTQSYLSVGSNMFVTSGSICVDNDANCVAPAAGYVAAVGYLTGHYDIAENIKTSSNEIEAGDVVIIDSENDNQFTLTNQPYDKRVAGVISTSPGVTLGSKENESGMKPLAIAGIVPTKVTTTNGPIERGDLLTTSSIPGYAMKASEFKLGIIVGKALESLESGEGKINVLITLQ